MRTTIATLALLTLPLAAAAAPPDACGVLTIEEVSAIAERPAQKTRVLKSGNPTECSFLDSRGAAVLVLNLKEVPYAVKDEFDVEKGNVEKIYRGRAKLVEGVGDGAFWMAGNHSFYFRKRKVIATVTFQTPKNRNEVDSAQVARLVETRIK